MVAGDERIHQHFRVCLSPGIRYRRHMLKAELPNVEGELLQVLEHETHPMHTLSSSIQRRSRTFCTHLQGVYDGLSLSLRLQNFLASYRTTPHSTTGIAPCELFLGRKLRTRLDLIKPDVRERVITKQCQQKDKHDLHARFRELHIGQKVMVRNMRPRPVWIPGEVIQTGAVNLPD